MNDSAPGIWTSTNWNIADPADAGLDAATVMEAISFHREQESDAEQKTMKRRQSKNVQAESKLGVVFKSKGTRKKVVMEATENDATAFNQKDLEIARNHRG